MNRKIIFSQNAPAPIGPYSQAVLVNETLYVSGQIAIDPSIGELIKGSIEEETEMVLKNVKAVLNAADMDFDNVVKASIFLKDMSNFTQVNEVYSKVFSEVKPARETVEVSKLPKDVNIEISVIAVK